MRRLCQITPHLSSGGVEQRIARVIAGIDRTELELTWIGLGERNESLIARAGPGVEVHSVTKQGGVDYGLILRIARILRRRRIDVVHVHNWSTSLYGIAAARAAGVREVIFGVGGRETPEGATLRQRAVMRVLAPYVDRFTTVCGFLAKEMAIEWGVLPSRIEVIRTGIDLDRFARAAPREEARRRLAVPHDAIVFGALTVLRPVKRIEDLIAAAGRAGQEDPRVHVALVGNLFADSEDTIRRWARDAGLGDRLRLIGRIEDPENVLPAFDAYVNCSVFEGASNAIMEAMASGLPIVATRVGGTPELVRDGQEGILVEPRNIDQLAAAFSRLANDRSLRAKLGEAAQRRAQVELGMERMISAYADLYRHEAGSKSWLDRSGAAALGLISALAMLAEDRIRE